MNIALIVGFMFCVMIWSACGNLRKDPKYADDEEKQAIIGFIGVGFMIATFVLSIAIYGRME